MHWFYCQPLMTRKGKENNENNKHRAITRVQEILEYSAEVSLIFMTINGLNIGFSLFLLLL